MSPTVQNMTESINTNIMPPRKSKMASRKSVSLAKAKAVSKNTAHERKNDTDVRFLWECVQDMKGPGTIHGKVGYLLRGIVYVWSH